MKLIKTKYSLFRDLLRINREYEVSVDDNFNLNDFKMLLYRSSRFETNFKDGKIELEYYSSFDRTKIMQSFDLNVEIAVNKMIIKIYEPKFKIILVIFFILSVFIGLLLDKYLETPMKYIVPVFLILYFLVFRISIFYGLKSCLKMIELFTRKSGDK